MGWSKTFLEWTESHTAYLSVVFTWDLPAAYQRAVWLKMQGCAVKAGGPAVMLMPDYLADVAECNGELTRALYDWNGQTVHTALYPRPLKQHNPDATFTSRGCVRCCPFCAVPRIEGDLVELDDWEPAPIVCDNNLLACSKKHFDRVVDRLKPIKGVDFNQGLDARLLTDYHAGRLAELDCIVRLAFDSMDYESAFMAAYERLIRAGFGPRDIRVYVLFGFNDTPEDALYRLKTVWNLGSFPNPMRYQPLDSLKRNSYVGPNWTHALLTRYMRYWSNLHRLHYVPFETWREGVRGPSKLQPVLIS